MQELTACATPMCSPWTEIWKFPATRCTSRTPYTCNNNEMKYEECKWERMAGKLEPPKPHGPSPSNNIPLKH